MPPTRRSFLKATAATIAAASFTWPAVTTATPAPANARPVPVNITAHGPNAVAAGCLLQPNGDLVLEDFEYVFNPDTQEFDLVIFGQTLVAAGDERLTVPELMQRLATAQREARNQRPALER